jgi:F-type H+-transporting ATPase subunit gamma
MNERKLNTLFFFLFKIVQQRLKSVQNIEKITKSMKMIASTKVTKAQRGMEAARAFGASSNGRIGKKEWDR